MKNPKFADIVDLSDAEIHSIQTEIPDLPKELEWRWRNCFELKASQKSKHPLNWMGSISRFALSSETQHLNDPSFCTMRNSQLT